MNNDQQNFNDTTDLLVYGHEGWLEFPHTHGHAGEKAEVFLKWGHNMQPDGLCRKEDLKAWVVDPEGRMNELNIEDGSPDYYALSFVPETEWFYQVTVLLEAYYSIDIEGKFLRGSRREWPGAVDSICYTHIYRTVVPVGHGLTGNIRQSGFIMELGPKEWQAWRTGDDLELKVTLNKEVMVGQEVIENRQGPDENRSSVAITDGNGIAVVKLTEPGKYMFLVRTSFPDRVTGSHEKREVTGTVTLLVTK